MIAFILTVTIIFHTDFSSEMQLIAFLKNIAIAGGFLIAFSEVFITYAWKKVLTYTLPEQFAPSGLMQLLATEYKFAVSFAILLVVILFKPTGLFKGK